MPRQSSRSRVFRYVIESTRSNFCWLSARLNSGRQQLFSLPFDMKRKDVPRLFDSIKIVPTSVVPFLPIEHLNEGFPLTPSIGSRFHLTAQRHLWACCINTGVFLSWPMNIYASCLIVCNDAHPALSLNGHMHCLVAEHLLLY